MSSRLCSCPFNTQTASSHAQNCCNKFAATESATRAAVASTITSWNSVTSWRRTQAVRPTSEPYIVSGIGSRFRGAPAGSRKVEVEASSAGTLGRIEFGVGTSDGQDLSVEQPRRRVAYGLLQLTCS